MSDGSDPRPPAAAADDARADVKGDEDTNRKGAQERVSEPTELSVYRHDPLFRHQHAWVARRPVLRTFLIFWFYACALFLPMLVTSTVHGQVTFGGLADAFAIDKHHYPFFRWIFGSRPAARVVSSRIVLLRDYSDLAAILLVAAHTAFLHTQWDRLSSFPRRLGRTRMLKLADTAGNIHDFERDSDRLLNRIGPGYVMPALGALLIATFLMFDTFKHHGLYPSLADRTGKAWEHLAYAHWWANPTLNLPGSFVEFAFLAIGFYFVFRHNWVGTCVMIRLYALVPVPANASAFTLLDPEMDSDEALHVMRTTLGDVAISTLMLLPTVFFLFLALPSGGYEETAIVVTGLCVIAAPTYLVLPLILFNRHLRLARREATTVLRAKELEVRAHNDLEALVTSLIDLERVNRVPQQFLSGRQLAGFVVVYLIPAFLFVDWVIHNKP